MSGRLGVLRYCIYCLILISTAGCAEFRGIPTHGGGKRFDEEERVVSGSIRRALADMDLTELSGKRVVVQLESISHTGGGYVNFPGIQNFSGSYNKSENSGLNRYLITPTPGLYIPFGDSNNENSSTNYGANAAGSFTTNYTASTVPTDSDLNYLRAALIMKAQHSGLKIVPDNPECILFVLVDVMGTNRSRNDSLLFWTDRLLATCELTYYAQDSKTGALLFRARQAAAEADYVEKSIIGFSAYKIGRTLGSTKPDPLPVNGEEAATYAKIPAKQK